MKRKLEGHQGADHCVQHNDPERCHFACLPHLPWPGNTSEPVISLDMDESAQRAAKTILSTNDMMWLISYLHLLITLGSK